VAAATLNQHTTLAWISPRRAVQRQPALDQSAGRANPWSHSFTMWLQKEAARASLAGGGAWV
jgi:hypothetical protein